MFKLFLADLKMLIRNRQALFWSLMFPLMFTFIFGFFFGKNNISGSIALINNSKSEIGTTLEKSLVDSDLFNVNKETDVEKAKEDVKKNDISAVVVIPEGFGDVNPTQPMPKVKLIIDPGNAQTNAVLVGYLDKFLTNTNYQVQKTQPLFQMEEEKLSTRQLTYFDFVLAGILGLALMNSSIVGIAVGMAKYREDKILKRITTTPMKTWWFIVGEVLSRLILNIAQIALILSIGHFFFDAHIYGNLFVIFGLSMLGAILFQLIGFVIASFSKTTEAAEGMATAITIPMMFLAGVFFPIDTLPKWLYSIVQFLPLAPLLRIIRNVTLEARSPFENPTNILLVAGWVVITLIIASTKFKLVKD